MTLSPRIRRGDVILVNLDPVIGHEIGRKRPAVVIQNDVGNEHSPTLIVVAVTDYHPKKARFPICVVLDRGDGGLDRRSVANASQIRTIDRRRVVGSPLGSLSTPAMERVVAAVKVSLALDA